MQRLREQRGLNYGDYAYIEHFQQQGGNAATAQLGRARHQQDFTAWLRPVQNENRLFALRAAVHELSRSLDADPFAEDEVQQTKGFLDGYLLLFDQTDARSWDTRSTAISWASRTSCRNGARPCAGERRGRERRLEEVGEAGSPAVRAGRSRDGRGQARAALGCRDSDALPEGRAGERPGEAAALLEADRAVNGTSFGARGEQDVVVVPVEKMFE